MGPILTGLAAFAAGLAVSFVNYRITVRAMDSEKSFALFPVRVFISAAFITLLFLLGSKTGLDLAALLIGGALGCTLGMAGYTLLLGRRQKAPTDNTSPKDEE